MGVNPLFIELAIFTASDALCWVSPGDEDGIFAHASFDLTLFRQCFLAGWEFIIELWVFANSGLRCGWCAARRDECEGCC